MRRRLALGLALLIALIIVPATAQRPDPHSWTRGQPDTTPQATATLSGCELIAPYTNALYTAINGSGAFLDYFTTPDVEVGGISTDEAEDIIADGNAMIAELKELDAPGPYVDANRNIIVFLQIRIDTAHFLGVDTSQVPDLAASDAALDAIVAGEAALAKACPDEVAAINGYILINPSDEDAPPNPEHVPEGTLPRDTEAVVWMQAAMEHDGDYE